MQINIATRHGYLSDTTRAKISAKVSRLSRYFDRLAAIDVTVDLEHNDAPIVEILLSAEHKHDFVATVRSSDLWRSVHRAVQKIEQQLRKYKERVVERHRTPGARQQGAAVRE